MQGLFPWFLFNRIFVVVVAIRGAMGLRTIAFERGDQKVASHEAFMWIAGLGQFALGARAVGAVTFSAGLSA